MNYILQQLTANRQQNNPTMAIMVTPQHTKKPAHWPQKKPGSNSGMDWMDIEILPDVEMAP